MAWRSAACTNQRPRASPRKSSYATGTGRRDAATGETLGSTRTDIVREEFTLLKEKFTLLKEKG
eukprot:7721695-Pyramimonas_sp.AAC.1